MTYAQMISEDKKRLQLLENQIVQASQMQEDSQQNTKFLEQLKNSTFGVEESKMAYKSCGSYASLESKFQASLISTTLTHLCVINLAELIWRSW